MDASQDEAASAFGLEFGLDPNIGQPTQDTQESSRLPTSAATPLKQPAQDIPSADSATDQQASEIDHGTEASDVIDAQPNSNAAVYSGFVDENGQVYYQAISQGPSVPTVPFRESQTDRLS